MSIKNDCAQEVVEIKNRFWLIFKVPSVSRLLHLVFDYHQKLNWFVVVLTLSD
jgi:hypothetical protein